MAEHIFKIMMKDLSAEGEWVDVTASCLSSSFNIRKGFGSLGSTSDVSKLSITYRPEDLAVAVLFHTTAKQIQVYRDGSLMFEGYTEGSASVESTPDTSLAWVKMSAYPYSKAFEDVAATRDIVIENRMICNPDNPSDSLLHILVDYIYDNLQEPFRQILAAASDRVLCGVKINKMLPLAYVEAGDSVLDVLDQLLKEFGLARYMEGTQMIIVQPYAEDGRAVRRIPYSDILSNPSIDTAPYIVTKKTIVTLGKVLEYDNEQVYQLRNEDEAVSESEQIQPGESYPSEGDLKCNYTPKRSANTDTLELIYATGLTYEVTSYERTGKEYLLSVDKAELGGTSAFFRFSYTGNSYAYLNQLTIDAEKAYYRDTSTKIEDDTIKGNREEENLESSFMVDVSDAEYYIKTYRAEMRAETSAFSFSSDRLSLQPNDLIIIGDIGMTILIRYTELDIMTDEYRFEGVAYDVRPVNTTTSQTRPGIQSGFKYINLQLTSTAYKYNSSSELSPSDQLITASVIRYGTITAPDWYINGELQQSHDISIPVPASKMAGRSFIVVRVEVGDLVSENYIFRVTDGAAPIIQYRRSDSETQPPVDIFGIFYQGQAPSHWGEALLGEFSGYTAWQKDPPPRTDEYPHLWMRSSTDNGKTWAYSKISGDAAKDFSINSENMTYTLSSRGEIMQDTVLAYSVNRQNMPTPDCVWHTSIDGAENVGIVTDGDNLTVTLKDGFNITSFTVQATIGSMTKRVVIQGVRETEAKPVYLGEWPDGTTPLRPDAGDFMIGDYYLRSISNADGTKNKIPMYWTGTEFAAVAGSGAGNYSEIMSGVLGDALKDPLTLTSTSALYGFFQNFASVDAFIRFLRVWNLYINKGSFSCEIATTDSNGIELAAPVFKVTYAGKTVFQIVPSSGLVFLGEPDSSLTAPKSGFMYNPSTQTIESKDKKTVVRADGTLESQNLQANNADINGNVTANKLVINRNGALTDFVMIDFTPPVYSDVFQIEVKLESIVFIWMYSDIGTEEYRFSVTTTWLPSSVTERVIAERANTKRGVTVFRSSDRYYVRITAAYATSRSYWSRGLIQIFQAP